MLAMLIIMMLHTQKEATGIDMRPDAERRGRMHNAYGENFYCMSIQVQWRVTVKRHSLL